MKILPTSLPGACVLALTLGFALPAAAQLEAGAAVRVTIRGVPVEEQQKVNGEYRIGDSGTVRLPLVDNPVPARGLTPDQFARNAEKAYREAGVYAKPAIEAEAVAAPVIVGGTVASVTVGGQVRRAGQIQFVKGMTLVQAIQTAGDRNEFGGRNIKLFRKGKAIQLDFRKAEHKNLSLEPGDAITVEVVGIVETDRG